MKQLLDLFIKVRTCNGAVNIASLMQQEGVWFDTETHPRFGRTLVIANNDHRLRINIEHIQGGN